MGLQINWFTSIIEVTSPTTEVSAQELHDFIEDQMVTPVGFQHDDVISPEGKIEDKSNPGVFSQIILILNSPWQVQFWQGSGYTRLYGGKFVGGLNDEVLKATGAAGDISVLQSPVDGVTTVVSTGSGLSTAQDTKLTETHAQVDANLKTIEGSDSHAMVMRVMRAALCGTAMDADTDGPITEATTRIAYMSSDGSKKRIIFDVVNLFGTRTGATLDMSP